MMNGRDALTSGQLSQRASTVNEKAIGTNIQGLRAGR
jgi:hypothetical protein